MLGQGVIILQTANYTCQLCLQLHLPTPMWSWSL